MRDVDALQIEDVKKLLQQCQALSQRAATLVECFEQLEPAGDEGKRFVCAALESHRKDTTWATTVQLRGMAQVLGCDIACLSRQRGGRCTQCGRMQSSCRCGSRQQLPMVMPDRVHLYRHGQPLVHARVSWRDELVPRLLGSDGLQHARPLLVMCWNGSCHYEVALPANV